MSKWDVERALSQVEPEVDALERVRLEVLESRAQGAKKMGLATGGCGLWSGVSPESISLLRADYG